MDEENKNSNIDSGKESISQNNEMNVNCSVNEETTMSNEYDNSSINNHEEKKKHKCKFKKSFKKVIATFGLGIVLGAAVAFTILIINTFFSVSLVNKGLQIGKAVSTHEGQVNVAPSNTGDDTICKAFDVSPIVEKGMPSVVAINVDNEYIANSWFFGPQTYEGQSRGSGIIIGKNDNELLIVTNNHVIENNKDIKVVFIDGKELKATVKGGDAGSDIAIIAVNLSDIPKDTLDKISVAEIGNYDDVKVGQGVVAIGNALGYGQSVTVGYISALNRQLEAKDKTIDGLLQTDAAINPGNSGGALLNMKGQVIAINSAKYSSTDVEGMGYAIPISKVIDIIKELSQKQARDKVAEKDQGYIGIQGQNISPEMSKAYDIPQGVYVFSIAENSPAAASDLREKDIITKFDGETVRNMDDIKDKLSYYKAGETVQLGVKRLKDSKYEDVNIKIILQKKP